MKMVLLLLLLMYQSRWIRLWIENGSPGYVGVGPR